MERVRRRGVRLLQEEPQHLAAGVRPANQAWPVPSDREPVNGDQVIAQARARAGRGQASPSRGRPPTADGWRRLDRAAYPWLRLRPVSPTPNKGDQRRPERRTGKGKTAR